MTAATMDAVLAAPVRTARPTDFLAAMRPRQWSKNIAVLAAVVFAHRLGDPAALAASAAAVAVFCLLGSAVYLANDLADRERDRMHPTKCSRPIAAGIVRPTQATVLAVLLGAAGLALAFAVNPATGIVATGYLVLQALYTAWFKHAAILDIFSIAASFVARVVAGAEAVQVPISTWLYLCTLLLSLFLALGKRRHELVLLADEAAVHRQALAEYSLALVDQLTVITAAALVVAYSLYTTSPDTVAKFGTDALRWTIPLVLYGLFRYLYLLHRRGDGGEPERVLLGDRPILATCVLWAAMVGFIVYLR